MFEQKLNELLKTTEIKLQKATYNKGTNSLSLVLSYPENVVLTTELRNNIKQQATQIAQQFCPNVSVSLKKAFVDQFMVQTAAKKIISANFPLIFAFADNSLKVNSQNGAHSIEITVDNDLADYVKTKNVSQQIEEKLSQELSVNVPTKINFADLSQTQPEPPPIDDIEVQAPTEHRFIKVFNKEKFVGEEIQSKPLYISDVKSAADSLTICGQIQFYSMREFTTKAGKQRNIAKFTLKDPTGEFHCFMFVSETNKPKMEKLADTIEVLVEGECTDGQFGGLELKVKNIMLCEIEKNFTEEVRFKPVPKSYKCTFPEKLEHKEQISLFQPEHKVSDYLQNNDIVVFDLETTGLNFLDSEIIEIGAIKIKKGSIISEKFSTYVKPNGKIPKEITELTGITNDDVKNGSSLQDALADFYKFTRNTTLVGHNVNFDYGFIAYYGKKVGYDFSKDPKHDTYALATKYVSGLKNYKLKTVAEHFGISLKNAHRAYHDAYATAEVYLKLNELM